MYVIFRDSGFTSEYIDAFLASSVSGTNTLKIGTHTYTCPLQEGVQQLGSDGFLHQEAHRYIPVTTSAFAARFLKGLGLTLVDSRTKADAVVEVDMTGLGEATVGWWTIWAKGPSGGYVFDDSYGTTNRITLESKGHVESDVSESMSYFQWRGTGRYATDAPAVSPKQGNKLRIHRYPFGGVRAGMAF
jgi:hypothetical protein